MKDKAYLIETALADLCQVFKEIAIKRAFPAIARQTEGILGAVEGACPSVLDAYENPLGHGAEGRKKSADSFSRTAPLRRRAKKTTRIIAP